MAWLDTTIVVGIIAFGLVIFYKALKEPLDMLGGLIMKGLIALKDAIAGSSQDTADKYQEIRYG